MSASEDLKAVIELAVAIGGMKADVERLKSELALMRIERDELQLQVGEWKDVAEQFRDALVERGKVVGFFASVIKSGEPWTPQCDEMLRATFVHKDIVPAAQPSTDTWEDTRARCS